MPRMWMVPVKTLCRKHLVAEHHECHVFAGRIRKGMTVAGWLERNYLEAGALNDRHDDLATEMVARGLNHNPASLMLTAGQLTDAVVAFGDYAIDKVKARQDLHSRCPECKERYDNDPESHS